MTERFSFHLHFDNEIRNKPKMAYSRNLPKMAVMDYHGLPGMDQLAWTIWHELAGMDWQAWTGQHGLDGMDWLAWTVIDYHGLILTTCTRTYVRMDGRMDIGTC